MSFFPCAIEPFNNVCDRVVESALAQAERRHQETQAYEKAVDADTQAEDAAGRALVRAFAVQWRTLAQRASDSQSIDSGWIALRKVRS